MVKSKLDILKKVGCLIFLLAVQLCVFSQTTITGIVRDAVTKEPIVGSTVFISNTSYATSADKIGAFNFTNIDIQRGDIVATSIGYEVGSFTLTSKTKNNIVIELQPKITDLNTVTIRIAEKNGYEKWGKVFFETFIGITAEAKDCIIENSNVLKFYFDKKINELEVIASEPIKISNKALGYFIDYSLTNFKTNLITKTFIYGGYPSFKEMTGAEKKIRQWKINRNAVYKGSRMHFLRSLYKNRLKENGFSVFNAKKVQNKNTQAQSNFPIINETIKKLERSDDNPFLQRRVIAHRTLVDSVFEILQKCNIDSIAFAIDSTTAAINFEDYLLVVYEKRTIKKRGQISFQADNFVNQSYIKLLQPEDLQIFSNGSFVNAANLYVENYWATYENLSRLLPYDFIYAEY